MSIFGLNRLISAIILLLPIAYLGVSVYGYKQHWGADQWGDLATWIAGISTSGAVLVALWQTHLARRDAEQARADAAAEVSRVNERLTKELEAADDRLARELDAARRMEQVRTIPPIWVEVTAVSNVFVLKFKDAMREGPATYTGPDIDVWMKAHIVPFQEAVARLELAFSPAVMLISEPNTQRLITELYAKTRKITPLVEQAGEVRLIRRQTPDLTELDEMLKDIRLRRREITNTVREHLTQVPPLQDPDAS